MKLVAKVLALGALAFVLLAVAVGLALDPLVVTAIEKGATFGTGTTTTLDGADVGLVSGGIELSGLRIQNPAGFRDEPFLALDSGRVEASVGSLLLGDTIDVPLIALDGVTINVERSGSETNYGAILDHLERRSGPKPDRPPSDAADGPTRSLRIGRVRVTGVTAGVHLDLALARTSTTVAVPRFELTNFESNGSTSEIVARLTEALIRALLDAVVRSDSELLPRDLVADLKGQLADFGSLLGTPGDERGEALKASAKRVKQGAEEAVQELKGILGGK